MADDIDRAAELEDLLRSNALKRKKPEAPSLRTGSCFYCSTPVEAPRRWCDAYCARDWEKQQDRKKMEPV